VTSTVQDVQSLRDGKAEPKKAEAERQRTKEVRHGYERPSVPSCLILDLSLPGLSGLDLQKRIARDRNDMPIIFITGHGDIPSTVQAMKAGAVEFLTKPFTDDALLCAIRQALERSSFALVQDVELQGLRDRYASLSLR